MTVATKLADMMGVRSSRRAFMRFAGVSALGTGLALTGLDVSAAEATGCYGCGGGSICSSPAPECSGCPTCGGFCPSGWTTQGYWNICNANNCRVRCVECCKNGSGCHCWVDTGQMCGGGTCPC